MKKIFFMVLIALSLNANDKILSESLRKNFDIKQKQINRSSDSLKNSWVSPIILNAHKGKNKNNSKLGKEDVLSLSASWNQDIFRSGGIFYAIKYAQATRILGLSSVEKEKNAQTIKAYLLLNEILKNDKMQLQQKLSIKNAKLDVKRKKEEYVAGLIDVSLLNDAMLAKIAHEKTLLSLQDAKDELLARFESLSDKEYKSIVLPKVRVPSKEEYIAQNISLKVMQNESNTKKYLSKVTRAKYLPRVSINASYHSNEVKKRDFKVSDDYYNYGIGVSIPIDIKSLDDMESSRLKYLVSKNELQILKQEQIRRYDRIVNDIKRIDAKIKLAEENIKVYDSLLKQTKELVDAQIKVSDDLHIMGNTHDIRKLDMEIYELDKNAKKLEFYKDILASF